MTQEKLNVPIDQLHDASAATHTTRDEFTSLFAQSVTVLELTPNELARLLKTSPATIKRWWAGTSTPHHFGRPSIFKAILVIAYAKRLLMNAEEMDRQSLENIRAERKKSR